MEPSEKPKQQVEMDSSPPAILVGACPRSATRTTRNPCWSVSSYATRTTRNPSWERVLIRNPYHTQSLLGACPLLERVLVTRTTCNP